MKTFFKITPLFLVLFLATNCGYRNPNVYSGPSKIIYLAEWKNRTSELGLDAKIYRSLTKWFQYAEPITTVRQREGADMILAGEIISIVLPSISYGVNNDATEVKIRLRVRYILKDISSKKILLEVPDETWIEEYLVSSDTSVTTDNAREGLENIVDDISKKIYQRTVAILPTLEQ